MYERGGEDMQLQKGGGQLYYKELIDKVYKGRSNNKIAKTPNFFLLYLYLTLTIQPASTSSIMSNLNIVYCKRQNNNNIVCE